MIKFCPRCGAKNVGREPVCPCGQKLYGLLAGGVARVDCVVCSQTNPSGATFCTGCGRRMDEPPPERSRPELADLGARSIGTAASPAGPSPLSLPPLPARQPGASAPTAPPPPETTHYTLFGCLALIVLAVIVSSVAATFFRQGGSAPAAVAAAATAGPGTAVPGNPPGAVGRGGAGGRPAASAPIPSGTPARSQSNREPLVTPAPTDHGPTVSVAERGMPPAAQDAARPGSVAGGAAAKSAAATAPSTPATGGPAAQSGSDAAPGQPAAAGSANTSGTETAPGQLAAGAPATAPVAAATAAAPPPLPPTATHVGPPQPTPTRTPVTGGGLLLRIDGVAARSQLDVLQAGPGLRFIVITATIENIGTEPLRYDAGSARLVDNLGKAYPPLPPAKGDLRDGTLMPGDHVSGAIAFEAPTSRGELSLVWANLRVDLSGALN